MSGINFQKTYLLNDAYEHIRECANQILYRYLEYPALITFNDTDRSVTFSTERLIPMTFTNRPRVMLLFSNPHPYSVYQGMFLSPNTLGRENLFWSIMADAGWIRIEGNEHSPKELADICLNVQYQGPFDLIFYCYYAFPTDYPEDIRRIFGRDFFRQVIEPEAKDEFRQTILETSVEAVVTFNKNIFNLISVDRMDQYIKHLISGKTIQSQTSGGIDRKVSTFLTFPTGWRYHQDYKQIRTANLAATRTAICNVFTLPAP